MKSDASPQCVLVADAGQVGEPPERAEDLQVVVGHEARCAPSAAWGPAPVPPCGHVRVREIHLHAMGGANTSGAGLTSAVTASRVIRRIHARMRTIGRPRDAKRLIFLHRERHEVRAEKRRGLRGDGLAAADEAHRDAEAARERDLRVGLASWTMRATPSISTDTITRMPGLLSRLAGRAARPGPCSGARRGRTRRPRRARGHPR